MTQPLPQTLHLSIHGRVQGVGFRAGLADEADCLGLSGWVRNRRDGSVEALIHGDAELCKKLVAWAERGGPPAARVTHVDVRPPNEKESAPLMPGEFRMLPTE
ncbi:MAG TPA: acylphosphatase [Burkholderiaceae bacterium]|nr:acylphosphatase [Burkholderiaceae bacterium]